MEHFVLEIYMCMVSCNIYPRYEVHTYIINFIAMFFTINTTYQIIQLYIIQKKNLLKTNKIIPAFAALINLPNIN